MVLQGRGVLLGDLVNGDPVLLRNQDRTLRVPAEHTWLWFKSPRRV